MAKRSQVKDKSIILKYMKIKVNGPLHEDPLVVGDEAIEQISISCQWISTKSSAIELQLKRDGEIIAQQDVFGPFDGTFN
jgi:hypothetical protein